MGAWGGLENSCWSQSRCAPACCTPHCTSSAWMPESFDGFRLCCWTSYFLPPLASLTGVLLDTHCTSTSGWQSCCCDELLLAVVLLSVAQLATLHVPLLDAGVVLLLPSALLDDEMLVAVVLLPAALGTTRRVPLPDARDVLRLPIVLPYVMLPVAVGLAHRLSRISSRVSRPPNASQLTGSQAIRRGRFTRAGASAKPPVNAPRRRFPRLSSGGPMPTNCE